jgi:phytoene dehydrogenase-like protein
MGAILARISGEMFMAARHREYDAVVVGGGLAGLTAGAILARGGRRVVVLEKGREPGGRAQTQTRHGFQFNLGPHALYRNGEAARVLRDLGVPFRGSVPDGDGALARGKIHRLPGSVWSLLRTTILTVREKWELARLFPRLPKMDATCLESQPVREWLEGTVRSTGVRQLMEAIVRVTTYVADMERLNAGVALRQIQLGLAGGVWYLDGGWTTLVEGLRAQLLATGGEIVCSAACTFVEPNDDGYIIHLRDGGEFQTRSVVIAAGPAVVADLLPGADPEFLARLRLLRPILVATLDIALSRLPDPRRTFALGIDEPLYFSVHSHWARLGPAGGAMVHVMKYLKEPARDAAAVRRELEALVDLCQPGWRELVVDERFMPHLVAANRLVTPEDGGLVGRPGPECPGLPGVYLAGDWVGPEGLLADAALASASLAAKLILERRAGRSVRRDEMNLSVAR